MDTVKRWITGDFCCSFVFVIIYSFVINDNIKWTKIDSYYWLFILYVAGWPSIVQYKLYDLLEKNVVLDALKGK